MQRANKSRKNEKLISKINKFFTLESTKGNIIHEAPPISVKDIFKHFWPYTPQKCLKYGLSQHLHLSSPYVLQKETAGKILVREGEIITKLSHPNLIRGYELHSKPQPVVIQETLTGKTISHLVRQIYKRGDELSLIQLAYFGKQIASVVNYLHQNNLLHLDIKPSNIISQPPLAKLFDLNLVTTPGTIRKGTGTKPYMSPEQASGEL